MLSKKLYRLQDIGGVKPSDMLCPIGQKYNDLSHMQTIHLQDTEKVELRDSYFLTGQT